MSNAVAVPARPYVLSDLVPNAFAREVALVAGAAAFVGLAAQVSLPLPGTPVPVTGQTFAVLLSGAALGWRRGALAMLLYLAAGAAGVPWYAGGGSGWGGPSFGYVLGFVAAATLVGFLAARGGDRTAGRTALTMTAGTLLLYAAGVPWLAASLDVGVGRAVELGMRPFLAGDALKVVAAAGLLPATWRLAGRR
ncbi:MAG TPA: biotin transporter BioY [Frankiaceae bacterium]|nr:biotin transporter BioY [Frankiaceae bacterium]